MKNRVLRLAIVAILVVAMVLTVAACGEKKPAPTQAPTPTKAPTQAPTQAPTKAPTQAPTKAPTVAPTVAPTEAPVDPYDAFVEKYGLTFITEIKRDKDDKKANDYDGEVYEFIVDKTKGTALYNAILEDAAQANNPAEFEISGKVVSAVNFEGKKIDSDSYFFIDSNNEPPAATPAPTADGFYATNAGTYTVNWTIKVSESGDAHYGEYFVPKASETITFTKIYVIEKAAVEVKPFESDLYLPIANQPDYDIEQIYEDGIIGLPDVVVEWIGEEDYSIYALSTITDLTVAGEFIVPIIVKNDKGVEVDPTTLVFANYNLTFKDGKLIVYTAEQDLAAEAAYERVEFALANPAAYALAVAEYEALDAVEKGLYADKYDPAPSKWVKNKIAQIKANIQKSAMDPKVEEAKALADAWFNSLKAADKLEAFNEFVLSLVTHKWDETKNEQKYVYEAFVAANTAAGGKYADLLGTGNFKVIVDRADAKEEDEDAADAAIAAVATVLGAIADADDLTEAKLAVIEKAIAYADTLVANASDDGKEDLAAAKAAYAVLVARYNAIFSIVDGYDAYIKGNYVSAGIASFVGYNFANKAIVGGVYNTDKDSAAEVIFDAPIYYVEDIAATYRKVVDDVDAFNAALVSAVADVRTLVAADMATYSKYVESFDGQKFLPGVPSTGMTRLAALQAWLVNAAMDAFPGEYESVAKKGIDEVIARSLKDAVKTVADFVEDYEDEPTTVEFSKAGTYELNKNVILVTPAGDDEFMQDAVVANGEGVVLNIVGGTYDVDSNYNSCTVWATNGAVVNISGGTFYCDGKEGDSTDHVDMIYTSNGGKINISGGFFASTVISGTGTWLLNEKDNNRGTIVVKGGTFVNWNPANNTSEGPNTNFLATGFTVETEEQANGDTWYTVVPVAP